MKKKILYKKKNKEIIDNKENKENKENNINNNLRPKNNKRNENIDINVDYNDAYIDEINAKDNLKYEEMSEKKKKSEEIEFNQQVTKENNNKREIADNMKKPKNELNLKKEEVENKEINNEPSSNKGTKKKIKHKKIDLNMARKEETKNNDFSSSNATTPPSSSNDFNSLPKNNNINLKTSIQEEKSNKKSKKDFNYTSINNNNINMNNFNIKATNKGMIVNNKEKDNIAINLNLMKKVENEDNIKEPRTPNEIRGKPKQINYNVTNNNKRNNQKNMQYKKVNTPILNKMNNNPNNNTNNIMNIKTNINTSKNNELKRVDSSSKNNKLHSSKNSQQIPKENNTILKTYTNFVPYSSPHKLQKYQPNPFVDNSKYQNLGEKQSYQFKEENEQNQNISSRATKTVKSQKRKERKSCNYNTVTSMTMNDGQQVMSNDMIKFNNIKKSSYKTSTHKQAKGQRILSLENYNSIKSSMADNEPGTVFLSEMPKNVRINKKDLTPDSNRVSFNKNEFNKKSSNYTDMYIKHNNLKLNQQFNGKRQNYINNSNSINASSNCSNISTNNSMRIYKTANMLKSQHNSSSEKIFKGGNIIITDEGFKASDGKRYVMARNVKRIRREEEMGVPKGNEDKRKICSTNDSNRDYYDSANNNFK